MDRPLTARQFVVGGCLLLLYDVALRHFWFYTLWPYLMKTWGGDL